MLEISVHVCIQCEYTSSMMHAHAVHYDCTIFVIMSHWCAGELDANRSVPFRLTPAIEHLVSPIGIAGPLHMSMVAIARYRV